MIRLIIILLVFPALLYAQEFEFRQELDSIPLEIAGFRPHQPWAGGDAETCPNFCDIDADGDLDLFVGSFWGKISFFENVGAANQARYQLVTREFAGVNIGDEIYAGRTDPQFCDLDGDGDFDLFTSCGRGLIHYWENIGSPRHPEFVHITDSLEYIDVPGIAHLSLCDLDSDDDFDIFFGICLGTIYYYRNDGDPYNWDFSLVTNWFEEISVGWCANPCFVDIDDDGDYDLFVGNESGTIAFYRNDGDSVQWDFTLVTEEFLNLDVGMYASPELADIDADGDLDFLSGCEMDWFNGFFRPGDIYYYQNVGNPAAMDFSYVTHSYTQLDMGRIGPVNLVDIDADGDLDLFHPVDWGLYWIENIGNSANPHFLMHEEFIPNIWIFDIYPFFVDIDADGDYDIIAGESSIPEPSNVWLFLNQGTPRQPDFVPYSSNFVTGDFFVLVAPSLADIDADGDYDLFLSDATNYFYYENFGTAQWPDFIYQTNNWQGISGYGGQRASYFADMDDDGDLDLLIENSDTDGLAFYRNQGTPYNPVMVLDTSQFVTPELPDQNFYHVAPCAVDIDADGDLDLFMGQLDNGVLFFRNVTGEPPAVPPAVRHSQAGLQLSLGPNPANPVTWVTFTLPTPQKATLAVYNLLGQKVATLAQGPQPPGTSTYFWNAYQFASGVYVVRLEMERLTKAEKVVVLR